jgi:hypothetical protein
MVRVRQYDSVSIRAEWHSEFVLRTEPLADENDSRAVAAEAQDLPALEPLDLVDFGGDAYLGEVASMLRDSRRQIPGETP